MKGDINIMKFRMKKITALMAAAVLGASTFGSVSVMAAESTEAMAVTFKYAYAGKPLSEAKEAMVYLDAALTTEWIKSNTYHYKITLPAADADITVKVNVGDWDSKDISADW